MLGRIIASLPLFALVAALPLGGAPAPVGLPKLTNSIGMKLVPIPKGTFIMGSPNDEPLRRKNETQHEVKISKPFYMGAYPVTQKQYRKVMGTNPSCFSKDGDGNVEVHGLDTDDFPVENVSWRDARKFCAKLSALPAEKKAGRKYRLPDEAEWEYACRAGTTTPFHFGKSASSKEANFDGSRPYGGAAKGPFLDRTCKVGSYKPNAWGLYDMHGNVWQFCADWFKKDYDDDDPKDEPTGPGSGLSPMLRGGSWINDGGKCRAACRDTTCPANRESFIGFRVVCVTPKP
jgi:formylglycine-generating enzyme required for sulfatase activity